MTINMRAPANPRCQIYGETTVRCINTGTHWVKWGSGCGCGCDGDSDICMAEDCEQDYYSWECDGPHRYGEAIATRIPAQREAA